MNAIILMNYITKYILLRVTVSKVTLISVSALSSPKDTAKIFIIINYTRYEEHLILFSISLRFDASL